MSDPLIENFEIGLYEQYLEDLEKKYFQGTITWGPEKGEPYYSKTQRMNLQKIADPDPRSIGNDRWKL